MAETFLDEMKRFVGFDERHSATLRMLLPHVRPHFPAITDEFYATLLNHEGARAVFADQQQVERLKHSLAEWLALLFQGPHTEDYFRKRWEIGKVHVRIALPERYVFGAMNVIRRYLLNVLEQIDPALPFPVAPRHAVERILDIELAIITESYRTDYAERISRQNRLAAIGQIAASVNHELRNPLSVIGSSVYTMRRMIEKGGAPHELVRHLDKIDRNAARASKIAADLLEFAKGRPPEKKLVDVGSLFDDALRLATPPATITRETHIAPGLPPMPADRDQIVQVLLNLIQNAVDAMQGHGCLGLSARLAGDQMVLDVSDQGEGIADDKRESIFEPLFTTKATGTGLGLPICRNIVAAHGGAISFRSAAGRGSVFTVSLPMNALVR
ncbi:MAG: protoglobin domain-containing protein [Planctomycetota bacterium]